MKPGMMQSWKWALVLAGLLIVAATLRAAEPDDAASPLPLPAPEVAQADLPPNNISTTPDAPLSGGAAEIAKLAQGGVGQPVMLAFVGNAASKFNLGSAQIIYLNDLGVSGEVVNAMIERDAALDAAAQAATASLTAPNYSTPDDGSGAFPTVPPPDNSTADYATTDDANYFYNALAPYGSWIYVNGSGLCWQPTVCVANRDWRPYSDRGRWLDSDCGWYWQSDYSWGWAPFHYGRWLNDVNCGWVWSPDRVWGPAWVNWRHSTDYCGWAPLPPSARYVAGTGFVHRHQAVGANFEFGLQASHYTFVPLGCLSDYSPARYAAPSWQADALFHQTKTINHVAFENHRVVNHGIDPHEVAAVARTEIRHVEVREMSRDMHHSFQSEHLTKSDHGLVIFHPQIPSSSVVHTSGDNAVSANSQRLFASVKQFNAPQSARSETYPPGSLIISGRKTVSISQPLSSVSNVNPTPVSHHAFTVYPTPQLQAMPPQRTQHALNSSAPQPTAAISSQSTFVIPARFTAAQHIAAGHSTPQNTVAVAVHNTSEHSDAHHEHEPDRSNHESHMESHGQSHATTVEAASSPVAAFHSSVSSLSSASVSGHR